MRRYAIRVACQERQEPAEQHRQLGDLGQRHCFQIGESGPAARHPVSEGANRPFLLIPCLVNQYSIKLRQRPSQLLSSDNTGGWMRV